MPHDISLIATVAAGLGAAFVLGLGAARVGLPPLVGYLLAGIAVGPFTPGFVADTELAPQLAEIGVILLMFGVGLHFSIGDLLRVRRIAIPGAITQIALATLLGLGVSLLWGWGAAAGLVFGLALSVASTVVLLRALESRGELTTDDGLVAVGWLVVEDLVMVLVLVLLPAFAGAWMVEPSAEAGAASQPVWMTLSVTLVKVAAFVALMLLAGARLLPWLLRRVVDTGSRELFTLAVTASALGIAVGAAELFGVSFALGAFFAGVVINGSEYSKRADSETRPLQDAFAALFFVSVGMLFDPTILVQRPLRVLITLAIVVLGKSAAAYLLVRVSGRSHHTALVISASLAQIGEFSFILAGLGVALGLLPAEGQSLVLAGALLSITLNPLVFTLVDRTERSELAHAGAHLS